MTLLQMRGISKAFGATQALREVSFTVAPGEVRALIGENGAGKSTLMKVLAGALAPDRGSMVLQGASFAPRGPLEARQQGVAMIYQELTLCPHLSVEDNIMLGREMGRGGLLCRAAQRERVRAALALLGHSDLKPDEPLRHLSQGAQQLVEIARALVFDARLIVFDEPTSSLTAADVRHLFRVIRSLKERGIGVVYISHFLEEVREACDSYTVLRDGAMAGEGSLAAVTEPQLVSLMVGRGVGELFPAVPHQPGEPVLEISQLTGAKAPREVSLQLRRGEILGIAGLVGAGRTELVRAIYGLDAVRRGTVRVAGICPPASPRHRLQAGLGMVSENRKGEGLAQARSVADNLTLSRLGPYQSWGLLHEGRRRQAVRHWMNALQVKAASADSPVSSLSGGNQQKVAIARVLHQQADVLLLDEPTRGIDVGTKAEIYRLMGELAARGKAVLFVSSYLPELLAVCDRIGVMSRGRLRAVRPTSEWSEESIMAEAIGT